MVTKVLRGKSGQFAGSVGDGISAPSVGNPLAGASAPTAPGIPVAASTAAPTGTPTGETREMLSPLGRPRRADDKYTDIDGTYLNVFARGTHARTYTLEDGTSHRLDGPAHESWYPDGCPSDEWWKRDGVTHRLDGPAHQSWHSNGHRDIREFYVNGLLHRLDGPAHEKRYSDGRLRERQYWVDGRLYRLDGPAVETWDSKGVVTEASWYPDSLPKRLSELVGDDPSVDAIAAHNPACRKGARSVPATVFTEKQPAGAWGSVCASPPG